MQNLSRGLCGNLTAGQIETNVDMQYLAEHGPEALAQRNRLKLSENERIRLRDEFAMAALTGILSNIDQRLGINDRESYFSMVSYRIADAMLKARS